MIHNTTFNIQVLLIALALLVVLGTTMIYPEIASGSVVCTHPTTGKEVTIRSSIVDVTSFGAIGLDTSSDDEAFTAAFTCLNSVLNKDKKGTLHLPTGQYLLSESHTLIEDKNANWTSLVISGEGEYQTTIISENRTVDLFDISVKSKIAKVHIRDFRILARESGSGTALSIAVPNVSSVANNLVVTNMSIHGEENLAVGGYFTNNLLIEGGTHPVLTNLRFRGTFGAPESIEDVPVSHCLVVNGANHLTMTRSSCFFAESALVYSGKGIVNIFNNHSYGVLTTRAMEFAMKGGEVRITNTHMNSFKKNVVVTGADKVHLWNVLTLHRDVSRERGYANISIADTKDVVIINSKFTTAYSIDSNPNRVIAEFGSNVENVILRNNIFDELSELYTSASAQVVVDDSNIVTDRIQ